MHDNYLHKCTMHVYVVYYFLYGVIDPLFMILQIEIVLEKSDKFDNLMAHANAKLEKDAEAEDKK